MWCDKAAAAPLCDRGSWFNCTILTRLCVCVWSVLQKCEFNMDNLSKPELLTLLSIMEGELEARDLVIEALRVSPHNTVAHLQSLSEPLVSKPLFSWMWTQPIRSGLPLKKMSNEMVCCHFDPELQRYDLVRWMMNGHECCKMKWMSRVGLFFYNCAEHLIRWSRWRTRWWAVSLIALVNGSWLNQCLTLNVWPEKSLWSYLCL